MSAAAVFASRERSASTQMASCHKATVASHSTGT